MRRWLESAESGVWLLIFDNVEEPEALNGYLPTRHWGHVLITSRRPRWEMAAHSLEVREMDRPDSIELLLQHSGQSDKEGAASLAEALGDLPLALAQAAGFLADSGMPFGRYLELFQARRAELLRRGQCPDGYQLTVFATLDLALGRITSADAEDLLGFLACLAPDQIPRSLLDGVLDDPLAIADGLAALAQHSLIRCSEDAVEVHRLVQAVAWDRIGPEKQGRQLERAVTLLESRFPSGSEDTRALRECRSLHPHALQTSGLAEKAKVALEVTAELLARVGRFEKSLGRYREALPTLRRSLSILRDLYWDNHPRVLRAVIDVGEALSRQGDLGKARIGHEFALEHLEAAYGPDHPQLAPVLNYLGMIAQEEGRLEEAKNLLTRALQIKESTTGHDPTCLVGNLMNLGIVLLEMGELPAARQYQERALQILESAHDPEDVEIASGLGNLGNVCLSEGRLDEARGLHERALSLLETAYGPEHPSIATVLNSLGVIAKKQRQFALAAERLRRALKISENLHGPDHPDIATGLYQLAMTYRGEQVAEAKSMLLRALKIYEATYGPEHRRSQLVKRVLGAIEKIERRGGWK